LGDFLPCKKCSAFLGRYQPQPTQPKPKQNKPVEGRDAVGGSSAAVCEKSGLCKASCVMASWTAPRDGPRAEITTRKASAIPLLAIRWDTNFFQPKKLAMLPSSSSPHQVRPPKKALPGFAFRD
jgi:hypothetical protein